MASFVVALATIATEPGRKSRRRQIAREAVEGDLLASLDVGLAQQRRELVHQLHVRCRLPRSQSVDLEADAFGGMHELRQTGDRILLLRQRDQPSGEHRAQGAAVGVVTVDQRLLRLHHDDARFGRCDRTRPGCSRFRTGGVRAGRSRPRRNTKREHACAESLHKATTVRSVRALSHGRSIAPKETTYARLLRRQ